jgi:Glycosyltransferase GT-D fold
MSYPRVADEFETVAKICKGFSIARIGDGEIKLMEKNVYTRELTPVPKLADELKALVQRPHRKCLIGIPTMDENGDRYHNWKRHRARFERHFQAVKGRKYYSAFITRPDCYLARLETREYYGHVIKIWNRKRTIAIVSEYDSKLLEYVRLTHLTPPLHVPCPMYGAYAEIDRMQTAVRELAPDITLISCGVTATALAHRLTVDGLQAVDLGSIGGFLLRWHARAPAPVDELEYKAERETQYGPEHH